MLHTQTMVFAYATLADCMLVYVCVYLRDYTVINLATLFVGHLVTAQFLKFLAIENNSNTNKYLFAFTAIVLMSPKLPHNSTQCVLGIGHQFLITLMAG